MSIIKRYLSAGPTHVLMFLVLSVFGLSSCSEERTGWTITGIIEGAGDSTLYIERPSGLTWILVDSTKTDDKGNFSFTAKTAVTSGLQPIYRLRLKDRMVYFPIDSNETLTLMAVNTNLDRVHTLSGSAGATGFNAIDSVVNLAVERVGAKEALSDTTLIKQLGDIILGDQTCVVAYYAINRPIEDKKIFSTDDKLKVKLIGAAANRYSMLRPSDPRASELKNMFTVARERLDGGKNKNGVSMEAELKGRPNATLTGTDENNVSVNLDNLLDAGKITILNLLCYGDQRASVNTMALGDVQDNYAGKNFQIVQLGFDSNKAFWRQNAMTMPWTTVYVPAEDAIDFLMLYNVNPISNGPTTFIFDQKGELVKRVDDPSELVDELKKYM